MKEINFKKANAKAIRSEAYKKYTKGLEKKKTPKEARDYFWENAKVDGEINTLLVNHDKNKSKKRGK